jgi:hypothetical protein
MKKVIACKGYKWVHVVNERRTLGFFLEGGGGDNLDISVLSRVAEPENLKTVPVPTFYLNTVPVPAPVPGHLHAYTYTYTYMCISS